LVDTIESSAFGSCKKLTSITTPASIKFIGSQAFGFCEGLKSIYTNSITPVPLNSTSQVFWAVDKTNCTLYVPTGSINAYRTANQWGDFVTIVDASGLELSADTLLLAAPHGSSGKILITSNVDWNATSDQTWLSINPNSGLGSKEITFTAELNQLAGSRKATVTFRSSEASQTVTVIQSPFTLKNFKATATSSNQIDLSWQLDENADPVLIAYSKNNAFGKPVDGVTYLPGQVIPGGGIVLYSGPETQFSHTSLRSNTTYYYKAFSRNPQFYYEGISSNDTTLIDQSDLYSYTQDFSSGSLPAGWKIVDHQENGEVWAFNNPGLREIQQQMEMVL
jgi:Viral BACON domain/BspA type Leucine rich repeat region (6 copies)